MGTVVLLSCSRNSAQYDASIETEDETLEMKVFVATNRKLEFDSDGEVRELEPDGSCEVRFGMATVEIKKGHRAVGEKINDSARYVSAELLFSDPESGCFYKELASEVNCMKRPDARTSVLVYIHGFPNTFQDSIARSAKLAHIYSSSSHQYVPFVFSWPANLKLNEENYYKGRSNAVVSGRAAAQVFDRFVDLSASGKVHEPPCTDVFLVAHSMGVHMLRNMVQCVQKRDVSVFKAAILVAANEHWKALRKKDQLRPLGSLADQIVVYCHKDDGTLNLGYIAGLYKFKESLGHRGPSPGTTERIVADLSTVKCGEILPAGAHGYHHTSAKVVHDIRQVLDGTPHNEVTNRRLVKSGMWHEDDQVYRLMPFHKN